MQVIHSFTTVNSGELIKDASGFSNESVQGSACEKLKCSVEKVEKALDFILVNLSCEEIPCSF